MALEATGRRRTAGCSNNRSNPRSLYPGVSFPCVWLAGHCTREAGKPVRVGGRQLGDPCRLRVVFVAENRGYLPTSRQRHPIIIILLARARSRSPAWRCTRRQGQFVLLSVSSFVTLQCKCKVRGLVFFMTLTQYPFCINALRTIMNPLTPLFSPLPTFPSTSPFLTPALLG